MDYLVPEGADASDLAARLEQTCQEATSGCVLVSGRRRALRRALQDEEDASTLTATLSRPLDPAGGGTSMTRSWRLLHCTRATE